VHPRDEAGLRALAELRERAIINVAAALSESVDHMHAFFEQLMFEAGFYVACANLREHLAALGAPVCVPQVVGPDGTMLVARELCDVGLMLTLGERTVANDVDADGRPLVLITGANSGGKSTFLRSVGLALLMMSSGMFVAASSLRASAHRGLFTHFIRREDATMTRGRLDDELLRMRDIAEELHAGSVVLFNESFAATNEREGSEIARQIVGALLDAGVRVFYVTHMYDLAESLCRGRPDQALSLRAERGPDGRRTFKLVPSPPLETSYGEDLYVRVGGWRGTPPA
jgi:DNA mismatch repair ATPase MutS